jgi:hypothetical protein
MKISTQEKTDFSLFRSVQTGFGAHPASYPTGTESFFPGSKAAGVWIWRLTFL